MRRVHRITAVISASVALLGLPTLGAQRRTVQPLDTVQVTSRGSASAASRTRSVDVITRDDLDRRAGRSLAERLAVSLGVDAGLRSPAQADLSLRGSTFNQVVILVDGVRVSDAQSGHYALDLAVPAAMIERVEILRGGGSALYGSDAVGGVVNLVTRDDARAASASLRGGSYGGAGAAALLFGEAGAWRVRGGADADRSDGHRAGTDYLVTQLRLSAERPVGDARLVADVGQGLRQFGAANFYSPFMSDETTRSTTAALRLVPSGPGPFKVGGSLHTRRHTDLFTLKRDDPAFYQNQHTSWETGGEATVRAALSPAMSAVIGGELLDARLRSARLGDHRQWRNAAFGQLTFARLTGATVDLGLRGDWTTEHGAFASPSVGVSIPVTSRVQLRASANRGFRAPTWTERFYRDPANIGDSTLAVERFSSGEIGARATPLSWLVADVAYYERHATGLIDWARPEGATASTPWRTRNFASAIYRGVEATLRAPDLLGVDWTARASGLRFDASADPGTTGKYALRPLTRTVGLSASAPVVRGGTVSMDALRARRTGEDDHLMLNARATAPVRDLRLSLELVNLANTSYLDASGRPVASRSAFAGATWIAP